MGDAAGSAPMQRYLHVEDNGWYIRNMLLSVSAVILSLLVVVLGGIMYVLETKTALQGAASFGVVSHCHGAKFQDTRNSDYNAVVLLFGIVCYSEAE